MDFERALEYGLEGQAVLFVGSGFPRRATSVRHKLLKRSVELAAAGAEQSAAVSGHYGSADRRAWLCASRRHNNRDWFSRNKARYDKAVQDPALVFISTFGPHLPKLCPHFPCSPATRMRLALHHRGSAVAWYGYNSEARVWPFYVH